MCRLLIALPLSLFDGGVGLQLRRSVQMPCACDWIDSGSVGFAVADRRAFMFHTYT